MSYNYYRNYADEGNFWSSMVWALVSDPPPISDHLALTFGNIDIIFDCIQFSTLLFVSGNPREVKKKRKFQTFSSKSGTVVVAYTR